jgi:hypothetical protein
MTIARPPCEHFRICLYLGLCSFSLLFALSHPHIHPVPGLTIHCQSFHNFIAHLRLRLDAYIRNLLLYRSHMYLYTTSSCGFRNQYIIPIHISHAVLSQKGVGEREGTALQSTDIRGVMCDYGTREHEEIER